MHGSDRKGARRNHTKISSSITRHLDVAHAVHKEGHDALVVLDGVNATLAKGAVQGGQHVLEVVQIGALSVPQGAEEGVDCAQRARARGKIK